MDTQPAKRKSINVAFIGGGRAAEGYWAPLASQTGGISVAALWSRSYNTVESLNRLCFQNKVPIFYEYTQKNEQSKLNEGQNNLAGIIKIPIDLLLIVLPREIQATVLSKIALLYQENKNVEMPNVLCIGAPTVIPNIHTKISNEFEKTETKKHFAILDPLSTESVFDKMSAMLSDIGTITAGSFSTNRIPGLSIASFPHASIPSQRAPDCHGLDTEIFTVSCSRILRKLFGRVTSVNCLRTIVSRTTTSQTDVTAGSIIFDQDKVCTVSFSNGVCTTSGGDCTCLNPKIKFDLNVYGTAGNLKVSWDEVKNCYSLQRCLHHYEIPSYHPATGMARFFQTYLTLISHGEQFFGAGLNETLLDLYVAEGFRNTSETVLHFREQEQTQTDKIPANVSNTTLTPMVK